MPGRAQDERTIILGDDGRYVTLGRHSEPSEAEIEAATVALKCQGVGGWLATMSGTRYARRAPELRMLRELSPSGACWMAAVAAFQANRLAALRLVEQIRRRPLTPAPPRPAMAMPCCKGGQGRG